MLLFGGEEFVANSNRREFVFADSPEQDLLQTSIRVEVPGTVFLDKRDRKGPVLAADVEGHRSVGFSTQAVHLLVFLDEQFPVGLILGCVTTGGELRRSAQDVFDRLCIVVLHSLEKALTCISGRRERPLSRVLSQTRVSPSCRPSRNNRERNHRGSGVPGEP